MAKKKQSVPEYGTVTRKGTLYYRTRIAVGGPETGGGDHLSPKASNGCRVL